MAEIDKSYHKLLKTILKDGFTYEDPNRKNVNRIQIPSYQFIHNFEDGFPAITTKKLYWKGIVGELLWFLRGDTNIKYLVDNGINIWNKDAYNYYCKISDETIGEDEFKYSYKEWLHHVKNPPKLPAIAGSSCNFGDLGRIYGAQWRDWSGLDFKNLPDTTLVDQISNLIKGLREKPLFTQHIVTAWNPAELDEMALPPCHWSFEILVEPSKALKMGMSFTGGIIDFSKTPSYTETWQAPKYQFTLKWHQRSVDTFLGLPFNIASYALLAHIIGKMTNMIPKAIIGDLSNVHIYENHLDAVKEQLSRSTNVYNSKCELELNYEKSYNPFKIKNVNSNNLNVLFDSVAINDFNLTKHSEQPTIKAEMLARDN